MDDPPSYYEAIQMEKLSCDVAVHPSSINEPPSVSTLEPLSGLTKAPSLDVALRSISASMRFQNGTGNTFIVVHHSYNGSLAFNCYMSNNILNVKDSENKEAFSIVTLPNMRDTHVYAVTHRNIQLGIVQVTRLNPCKITLSSAFSQYAYKITCQEGEFSQNISIFKQEGVTMSKISFRDAVSRGTELDGRIVFPNIDQIYCPASDLDKCLCVAIGLAYIMSRKTDMHANRTYNVQGFRAILASLIAYFILALLPFIFVFVLFQPFF